MSRVAVFFATGYEEIEALTVVDILRRADIETPMVSITEERSGGVAQRDRLARDFGCDGCSFVGNKF